VERLNFLIKDVLDLSKIEYRRNVLFQDNKDLVAIIKETVDSLDFLSRKNGVKIALTHSREKIFYNTDEELFNQLVRNILENSIFYAGKGSQINIRIDEKEDQILLEFTDDGVGIKKEDIPFIFQRFYRGRPDGSIKRIGSGLGLSIVKHTVDLHGGKIKVKSKPDVQTRFSITLPKDDK
jgi:signal transduction histidine kinase